MPDIKCFLKVTLLDLTLAQIGVSGRFLDPILTLLELFSCVCELIFLKLHLITGFNKSGKNGCLENLCYTQDWVNVSFLGPKST